MTNAEIIVYESPISTEIIQSFKTLESFEHWVEHEKHPNADLYADQVSINGQIILGWDEYEEIENQLKNQ